MISHTTERVIFRWIHIFFGIPIVGYIYSPFKELRLSCMRSLLAIAANLTTLHRHGDLWMHIQPFYGFVQRLLSAAWFFWCAGYGMLLMRMRRRG